MELENANVNQNSRSRNVTAAVSAIMVTLCVDAANAILMGQKIFNANLIMAVAIVNSTTVGPIAVSVQKPSTVFPNANVNRPKCTYLGYE